MLSKRKNNSVAVKTKAAKLSADAGMVEVHMKNLKHPLKQEMEAIRKIIKQTDKKIDERIKWNAPSYYIKKEKGETDFLTFNHHNDKFVLLVFHHAGIIKIKSALLQGEYKDRRLIYFESMRAINDNKKELVRIISELLELIK